MTSFLLVKFTFLSNIIKLTLNNAKNCISVQWVCLVFEFLLRRAPLIQRLCCFYGQYLHYSLYRPVTSTNTTTVFTSAFYWTEMPQITHTNTIFTYSYLDNTCLNQPGETGQGWFKPVFPAPIQLKLQTIQRLTPNKHIFHLQSNHVMPNNCNFHLWLFMINN